MPQYSVPRSVKIRSSLPAIRVEDAWPAIIDRDTFVEAEEALHYQTIEPADPKVVREYVEDLKQLLSESGVVEKKVFLKSFIERIGVGESEAKITYTIPMPPNKMATETVGVLPFIQDGSPHWKDTELLFEKKQLIPVLQQLLIPYL